MISTSTVVNSVVRKLRAALRRGQWRRGEMPPGQRELAEQMGISRPQPARGGDRAGNPFGLVRSMPGKGVVVLETSVERTARGRRGACQPRRYSATALHPGAIQLSALVAQTISSKDVGQLRLTLMDACARTLEAGEVAEAGMNAYIGFHEELFALTSNPIFQNVVQQTRDALKQSALVLAQFPRTPGRTPTGKRSGSTRHTQQEQCPGQRRDRVGIILPEGLRMGIALNIPDDHLGS